MPLNCCRLRLLKLPLGDVLYRTRPSRLASASDFRFRGGCRCLLVGCCDSSRSLFTLLHVGSLRPPEGLGEVSQSSCVANTIGAYWITSSARPSSDGGIVRPRALAVLRLTTSSNFVGRSTGRSAGLAPLRILST